MLRIESADEFGVNEDALWIKTDRGFEFLLRIGICSSGVDSEQSSRKNRISRCWTMQLIRLKYFLRFDRKIQTFSRLLWICSDRIAVSLAIPFAR